MEANHAPNPCSGEGPIHRNRNVISALGGIIGFFLLWGFMLVSGSDGYVAETFIDIPTMAGMLLLPITILLAIYGGAGIIDAFSYLFRKHAPGKTAADAVTFFQLWAAFALATGFLLTVVGLVIMLKNMDDVSKIGPGMAISLLSQLYGVFIAVACIACAAIIAQRHNGPISMQPLTRRAAGVAGITIVAGTMTGAIAFGILMLAVQAAG
ncbi:MAG: MotA/TolQ/ExbB proton channel family protein [Phycisphaerae bacterium]